MTTIRRLQTYPAAALLLGVLFSPSASVAADYPEAEISNGQLKAKIFLPDAKNGYYRSTRFDWSGAIYSLEYKGHNFYGVWYDKIDPKVINWVHQGPEIVSGPCSALAGPVNEFQNPLGYEEAKPGGTFIKLGVGVLRKTEGNYNRFFPYEVLNPGKWTVKKANDSIEFTQELTDPESGYAYLYRKTVRLVKGKPEMVIEHSMKNTGKRAIKSNVYNHNFVVLDKQAPGPDFTFRVPFQIQTTRPPKKELVEVRGNEIVYQKPLENQEEAVVLMEGFGTSAADNQIVIENKKVGAGVKITNDRPLSRSMLWSIRTVLAVEPYIDINIEPGGEFTWKNQFEYYTLPASK
ncbi:MAG: hypothetical protein ABI759_30905 [Candidatus Solibacter sp.]